MENAGIDEYEEDDDDKNDEKVFIELDDGIVTRLPATPQWQGGRLHRNHHPHRSDKESGGFYCQHQDQGTPASKKNRPSSSTYIPVFLVNTNKGNDVI